ncbi:copper resistance CopC family protein [Catellatospora methionotrophica]|uniref:copper resistance CopC family protein n=1 Tax=Catellatospora methionotrophica TaxID=121620 RepID=UPI00140C3769|nr:copper resistance CopC family protein [Catellatospora methionotrophica]
MNRRPDTSARLARVLAAAAAAAAAAAVVLLPAPAQAHDDLTSAAPAQGSTVTSAPQQVALTFAGPVKKTYVTVAVTGPGGDTFQTGQPSVTDRVVTQALKPATSGEYFVAYQVISSDGHPITGRVQFTVALPGDPAPSSSARETSQASTAPADRPGVMWWPWAVGAALLALVAAVVMARTRPRRAR